MTTKTSLNHTVSSMVTIVRSSIPIRVGVPLKADQLKAPVVVDLGPTTRAIEKTGALPKCTLTPTDHLAATSTATSRRRKTSMTIRTAQGREGAVGEASVASHCKARNGATLTTTGRQRGLMEPISTRASPSSRATTMTTRAWATTSKATLGASIRSRTWVGDAVARAKQPRVTKVAIEACSRATLCPLTARMGITSPLSTRKKAKRRKLSRL